jgi:hypothetical protein
MNHVATNMVETRCRASRPGSRSALPGSQPRHLAHFRTKGCR